MTAPGDFVILTVLLVAIVACVGYAAGRFHQRRRNRGERGGPTGYPTGTRSVFSTAVRAARPALAVPPEWEPDLRPEPEPGPDSRLERESRPEPGSGPEPAAPPLGLVKDPFPVPPPPTGPGMPAPAAAGGVIYTSLPDPRWSGADVVPEQRQPEARRGRHTVPEELVRADTYRLPPDRVARARVVPAPEE